LSGFFLHRQARYDTASERLEESIEILRGLGRKGELSASLYALGESLSIRGQREMARPILEEAVAVSREVHHTNLPMILTYLGIISREEGDYAGARAYMEEALVVARSFGSTSFESVALNSLGDLARLQGDYERARRLYDQLMSGSLKNIALFTRPGQLHNQAYVAHHFGDDDKARRQFNEAIHMYRDMGDPRGVAECVAGLAALEAESNPGKATRLLSAAIARAEDMGSRLSSSNDGEYERTLKTIHARLDEPTFKTAWEEGKRMSLDEAVACATENS
jgi:tetratricopeptide (TPR) repeat protein